MREKVVCSLMLTDRYLELIDAYRANKDWSRSYIVRRALDKYFGVEKENKDDENEESREKK